MAHRLHTNFPAGLVAPGDLLLTAEGVAIGVTEVAPAALHPSMVVLTLEDGQMLTYANGERLTVKLRWDD